MEVFCKSTAAVPPANSTVTSVIPMKAEDLFQIAACHVVIFGRRTR